MSRSSLYDVTVSRGVYRAKCKICGYVAISKVERYAVECIRTHIRESHNIKL